MSSRRTTLLGQSPAIDVASNTGTTRRPPLIANDTTSAATPQSSRRTILAEPSPVSIASALVSPSTFVNPSVISSSQSSVITATQQHASVSNLLDTSTLISSSALGSVDSSTPTNAPRPPLHGLLDRTPAEKEQATIGPVISNDPAISFRSESGIASDDSFAASTSSAPPINGRPGLLDRPNSHASLSNDSISSDRGRAAKGKYDRRRRSRSRSRSTLREMSPASSKDRGRIGGGCILDRTPDEKQADAAFRNGNGSQIGKDKADNCSASSASGGDERNKRKGESKAGTIAESTVGEDSTETKSSGHHRIGGYRKLCVVVPKLTEFELRLCTRWRYCKFLSNTPRVHLTRLPGEVVDAIERRYANETKKEMGAKKKKLEKSRNERRTTAMTTKNSESSKSEKTAIGRESKPEMKMEEIQKKEMQRKRLESPPKEKDEKKKPSQKVDKPRAHPVLLPNIPGMPSIESVWKMKIKKKTEETSGSSGVWKKLGQTRWSNGNVSSSTGTTEQWRMVGSTSTDEKTEYVSPLMRSDAEMASKRRREEPMPAKRKTYNRPPLLAPPSQSFPLDSIMADKKGLNLYSQSSTSTCTQSSAVKTDPTSTVQMARPRVSLLTRPSIGPRTPPPPAGPTGPAAPAPPAGPPRADRVSTSRRHRPLLGQQPTLPNWQPDEPGGEHRRRRPPPPPLPPPPDVEQESAGVDSGPQESARLTTADGRPFDPMLFLNRFSDYSSDGDSPPPPSTDKAPVERTKENEKPMAEVEQSCKEISEIVTTNVPSEMDATNQPPLIISRDLKSVITSEQPVIEMEHFQSSQIHPTNPIQVASASTATINSNPIEFTTVGMANPTASVSVSASSSDSNSIVSASVVSSDPTGMVPGALESAISRGACGTGNDSEAGLAILALSLLANMDAMSTTSNSSLIPASTPPAVSTSAVSSTQNDRMDDSYDVPGLRSIIGMLLDDPTSILQSDQERRRRALELLPVLDELEALSRSQPIALTGDLLLPIMLFVHEIVELSASSATNEGKTGTIDGTGSSVNALG